MKRCIHITHLILWVGILGMLLAVRVTRSPAYAYSSGPTADAVSREVSVYAGAGGTGPTADAVSREVSVYAGAGGTGPTADAVSREVSVGAYDPVAIAQNVDTFKNHSVAILLTGSDSDGDPLSYSIVAPPAHGTLTGTAPTLTYTPTDGYTGTDFFTFKVNDGVADSLPAMVNITVMAPPTIAPISAQSMGMDTVKTVNYTVQDVDSPANSLLVTSTSSNTTLLKNAKIVSTQTGTSRTLTITPEVGKIGSTTITVTVTDESGQSASTTFVLTVNRYKPDLYLRPSTVPTYTGINIISLDGSTQTVEQMAATGVKVTYYVQVQNLGSVPEALTIRGTTAPSGWTVVYKNTSGGSLLTEQVTGSGWTTPVLAVNGTAKIQVDVTPGVTVIGGAVATLSMTVLSSGDPAKQDVGVMKTTVPLVNRPDLYLRPSTVTSYSGSGVYNLDGTNQTVGLSVANSVKATYYVTVKNNGNAPEAFIITAPTAPAGWTVTYNAGATVITSAVTTTGWTTPVLNPAATVLITVYVTPGATVIGGAVVTQMVTVTSSGDSAKQDVGIIKTTVPVLNRPDLYVRPSTVTSYLGSGVYNLDGTNQTVGLTVANGVKATYYVTVKNTGNVADTFTITGPAAPVGWTVEYKLGSTVITGAITTSGWTTPLLNPAATVLITVYVTPSTSVFGGVVATQTVTVTSNGDSSKQDVGVLNTTLPVVIRPDLQLRPSTVTTYIGSGVYNLDGTNQTVALTIANGAKATYYITVKNNGNIPETFIVTGPAAPVGWTVSYNAGATVITDAVTSTGWTTPSLNPAATVLITVYVTPTNSAIGGTVATQTMTVTSSTDPTKQDVGVLNTTLAVVNLPDLRVRPSTVSTYSGGGIYNLDGTNQTVGLSVINGEKATYYVTLKNNGNAPEAFIITGPAAPEGWVVAYNLGSTIITGAVTTTGWTTPVLNPAATVVMTVFVTPGPTVTVGAVATQMVTVTSSGDPSKQDVGVLNTATTFPAEPVIISFTPLSGSIGQQVTLSGTSFTGASEVQFNGTIATVFKVLSATSITATVPGGATTGQITVTTPGGTATSSSNFFVLTVGDNSTNSTDVAAMVWVPGGTFTMGSLEGVGATNEHPAHLVTLSGFWMYKYEVTVAQYRAFCAATSRALPVFPSGYSWTKKSGWTDPALQQHPIVNVSWDDAKAYADWAGVQLPTEAQWEYAGRGPSDYNYPWGGTATVADPYNGWDQTKSANAYNSSTTISTWPVGSFPTGASWCGAQDLAGNALEWCTDWYEYYSDSPVTNPTGPADGAYHEARGGCFWSTENNSRVAFRNWLIQDRYNIIGFRCVSSALNLLQPPTITNISPSIGSVGSEVTITGTNLAGTTTVEFHGTTATIFTVMSATSITVTVPNGATTGKISIMTPGGTVSSAMDFTVTIAVDTVNPSDVATMIWVPGGTFTMGSPDGVGSTNEHPAHQVTLSGFWMYKYEVTVAQYRAFCAATAHALPPWPGDIGSWAKKSGWTDPAVQQHPIVNVSWDDAKAYADWAGVKLPTDAQWEYAARGPFGRNYPWCGIAAIGDLSNGWDQTKCSNWYNSLHVNMSTWPVGSFPAGASWCGAQDLAGNAWEWCADWYGNYVSWPVSNPTGPTAGEYRVLRSCGFDDNLSSDFRGARRFGSPQNDYYASIGFRCVSPSLAEMLPPTVTSFAPSHGPVGSEVTITGTNLAGTTMVQFNGTTASFTVVSVTSITATVPNGASTGKISILTPGGAVSSATDFTVTVAVESFNPTDGAPLVWVPGGMFTMGSLDRVGYSYEHPKHQVTLSGYWMYKYEVTVAQYLAFCAATLRALPAWPGDCYSWTGKSGWDDPSLQQHPIVNVSWNDAKAYADWAGVQLPTEAQWKYAARGPNEHNYSWGGTATTEDLYNGWDQTKCANLYNSGNINTSTWPVGSFPTGASWCGAQDLTGNAWEWCADWYGSYSSWSVTNPIGPSTGDYRVLRGGSWYDNENNCRSTLRNAYYQDGIWHAFGFRCVSSSLLIMPAPTIINFSPDTGPEGTEVTITGTNLMWATAVTFNGTTASIINASDTTITALVPTGASTGKIAITTPGGTAISATDFTVIPPPSITEISPTSGPVGAEVTLTGANLTGTTTVQFNATVATSFTVVNDTSITVIVPSGASTGKITVTTPGGTATSTSEFSVIQPPTITDFTPSSGAVGTEVTLTGANLTGATAVQFNGTAATSFTVVTDTSITTIVPVGASTGKILVTTPAGTETSATYFTVTTNPIDGAALVWVPGGTFSMGVIDGVRDEHTGEHPAHQVTLSGYWIYKYEVTVAQYRSFCAATSHALPSFPSGGSWAGKSGWDDLALQNHPIVGVSWYDTKAYADWAGVSLPTEAQWEYASRGPAGNNYPWGGIATAAEPANGWDATKCANGWNSSRQFISTWPVGSFPEGVSWCGAYDLAGNVAEWCADWYGDYSSTPLTDPSGPASGTGRVWRGGAYMMGEGSEEVHFFRGACRYSYPPDRRTFIGFRCSSVWPDPSVPAPTISSFTPINGLCGTLVTISGTNFTGATGVKFNGTNAAEYNVVSATLITAVVDADTTTGAITVTTPDGKATSVNYFYLPPTITSFTPSGGPVGTVVTIDGANLTGVSEAAFNGTVSSLITNGTAISVKATVPEGATTGKITVTTPGGTTTSMAIFSVIPTTITAFSPVNGPAGTEVTITGTDLSGATEIKFNGTVATTFTVLNATSVKVIVPEGATTGVITMTVPTGTATSKNVFYLPPTITQFWPSTGGVGLGVSISGTNLTGATAVNFNGIAAVSFSIVSTSYISAIIPGGATTGIISITTPGGTATSSSSFTVILAPMITSFTPSSGPIGQQVTITGTNLTVPLEGSDSFVKFNGTTATRNNSSATSIIATVPVGATTGTISVTTRGGSAITISSFTVIPAPTITSFTPTNGPIGAIVTITGTNFTGATSVTFNGTNATEFVVVSATSITAMVGVGTTTGTVAVTTPGGTVASTNKFFLPPTITSFTPNGAPVGTVVTINGTNMIGATVVAFNETTSLSITNVTATSVKVIVPDGATTGYITVTTPGGTVTGTSIFSVIPTTITSFTPVSGPAGTEVTITGTDLNGVTAVQFNETPVTTFTVLSATSVKAAVPAGATTGVITVTLPTGIAMSTGIFSVMQPPTITSFSPANGSVGTSVTIAGTNFTSISAIKFNDTTALTFTVLSATSVTATVPIGATTGNIVVITPAGTAISTEIFNVSIDAVNSLDSAEMVWVPGGTFTMGCDVSFSSAEQPAHQVTLSGYWIYKYEVTVAQYRTFCTATSHAFPPWPGDCYSWTGKSGWDDPTLQQHPIVNVNWNDANAYASWAGMQLPTEAQWEYASCGPAGNNYPWGGRATASDLYNGWDLTKCANYSNSTSQHISTRPVGSFPAGASWCGAQDLAGNAWEWCADWWSERYEDSSPVTNPTGATTGDYRILRGGSWFWGNFGASYDCRGAARFADDPVYVHANDYGFRCVSP